jgi:hypothetical protein
MARRRGYVITTGRSTSVVVDTDSLGATAAFYA